jgi:hypothetical protein
LSAAMIALSPTWERVDVSKANAGRGACLLGVWGMPLSPDSLTLVSALPHVGGRATSLQRLHDRFFGPFAVADLAEFFSREDAQAFQFDLGELVDQNHIIGLGQLV